MLFLIILFPSRGIKIFTQRAEHIVKSVNGMPFVGKSANTSYARWGRVWCFFRRGSAAEKKARVKNNNKASEVMKNLQLIPLQKKDQRNWAAGEKLQLKYAERTKTVKAS